MLLYLYSNYSCFDCVLQIVVILYSSYMYALSSRYLCMSFQSVYPGLTEVLNTLYIAQAETYHEHAK